MPLAPRAHLRVDLFEPIRIAPLSRQGTLRASVTNLSLGGVRVQTSHVMPRGERVALELATPQGPTLVAEGVVAWAKPFEPVQVDGVMPGMGIRFTRMLETDRALLERWLASVSENDGPTLPEFLLPPLVTDPGFHYQGFDDAATNSTGVARPMAETLPERTQIVRVKEQPHSHGKLWVALMLGLPASALSAGIITFAAVDSFSRRLARVETDIAFALGATEDLKREIEGAEAQRERAAATAVVEVAALSDAGAPVPRSASRFERLLAQGRGQPPPQTFPRVPALSAPHLGLAVDSLAQEERLVPLLPPVEVDGVWQFRLTGPRPVVTKHFSLTDPDRLVIDVLGARALGPDTLPSEGPVTRIRVGQHDGFARVVFDLSVPAARTRVRRFGTSLLVRFTPVASEP